MKFESCELLVRRAANCGPQSSRCYFPRFFGSHSRRNLYTSATLAAGPHIDCVNIANRELEASNPSSWYAKGFVIRVLTSAICTFSKAKTVDREI